MSETLMVLADDARSTAPRLDDAGSRRARAVAWAFRLFAAGADKALADRDRKHDQQGADRDLAPVLETWQLLAPLLRIQAIRRLAAGWVRNGPHPEAPTWAQELERRCLHQLDVVREQMARRSVEAERARPRDEERPERDAATTAGRHPAKTRRCRRGLAARLRAFRRLTPAAFAESRARQAFRWHHDDVLITFAEGAQREVLQAGRRSAVVRGLLWLEARKEAAARAVFAHRRAALRELRAEAEQLQLMATSVLDASIPWLEGALREIDLLEQPTPGWAGLDVIKARATRQLEQLRAELDRRASGREPTIPARGFDRLLGWVGKRSRGAVSGVRSRRDRVLERVRARPRLVTWIVALALGIQVVPGYWWIPIGGFLVDDLGVGPSVPAFLSAAAFGAMGVGVLAFGPIACRYDQRWLACWLAIAGALAMALQGLFPVLAVVGAATLAGALTAVGIPVMTPLVLRISKEGQRGRNFGAFTMGWILTVSAILVAEPIVAHYLNWQIGGWEVAGWRVAAFGQAAIGLLSAPFLLVASREPEPRDTRRLRDIYRATLSQLKGPGAAKMRRVLGVLAVSGALFGVFHSTYSTLLQNVGKEHLAFLPAVAFVASTGTAWACGRLFDKFRQPRVLLVTAAAITAVAFVVGLAQLWVPVALVAWVLAVQALLTEVGTTAKTTVAPPAILDNVQGEQQNTLLAGPRFLVMSACAFLAAPLLAGGNPALTINLFAIGVGAVGVIFAWLIPVSPARG